MACEAGSKYMTRTMIGKILWHTKFEVIRYLFLRVNVRSTQTDGWYIVQSTQTYARSCKHYRRGNE